MRLHALREALADSGAVWVVRPKGRSEITQAAVMAAGKAAGLVDVKVVKFSETHTAEKFVIPVARRKSPGGRGCAPRFSVRAREARLRFG